MWHELGSFPLRDIVLGLLGDRATGWRIGEDAQWCHVAPAAASSRVQGWKLHVSAIWLSAPVVLHQAARVLIGHECAFKFAATLDRVWRLTNRDADRAQAGKFITVYPRADDQLPELAARLHEATAGLPGPAILSDRAYREGSLVHYRFGAFTGVPVLTNDGCFEARLETPDGSLVKDVRQPWFCPPAWARPPFDDSRPGRSGVAPAQPEPVLLADRFRVDRAISHSARGGVYRATDRQTNQAVVIKQARAHVAGLSLVGDARDCLRYERGMLRVLTGLAPAEVSLFAHGGHLFLAMEELDGQPLAAWTWRWWERPARGAENAENREGPPATEAVAMAGRLASLVDAVHERGLVFRDLSPSNVVVLADGTLRLVDAELVARPGQWVAHAYTPGFVAPELLAGPSIGPAPEPSADDYSLGALLCQLTTGVSPAFVPDSPAAHSNSGDPPGGRSPHERIWLLLRYGAAGNPAARRLAPAILGLTSDDPAQRWDTRRLRGFLDRAEGQESAVRASRPRRRLEPERLRRLVADGLARLVAGTGEAAADRLVPSCDYGARSDPCNVQHGAAGVLAVLVRGSELVGGVSLADAVERVARWIDRRRTSVPKLLPGLYFGRAGTAWALHAAAKHLGDDDLAERAVELLLSLPVRWPNPDITHGTAGLGMAGLHLWYETKEAVLLERVTTAADHLLEQAHHDRERVYWQVEPDFDSKLAGTTHYGFAHGVAGIGAFLLAAAQATGREDYRRAARQAGDTLAGAAVREGGAAYWPNDLAGPDPSDLRYHWCSGASGVGTFLVRLWQATGQARLQQLAHEAAVAVRRARWWSGVSACHGTAGNGEFLIDLAAACGGRYLGWARELAACLYARHALREGRLAVADELDGRPNLDFGTGLAGVVAFALRLQHGGPRWWMADAPGGDHCPIEYQTRR